MRSLIIAALVLALPQTTQRLTSVANPRTTAGSWVADPSGHLRHETVAALDSIISALERETTTEIAVVVLDSLDGLEPADAALALHRRWGVGKRERDNGIVFLWSPALRRTQVSIGYGLEGVLTDARTGRIQDEHVLPLFRAGDFDGGMIAGVKALGSAARGETYSGLPRVAAGRPGGEGVGERSGPPAIVLWLLGGGVGIPTVWALIAAYRRRRPRPCPRGHGRMTRLSEREDDQMLSREALLEEQLESMDYDVWVCGQCDEHLVLPYRRFTFKYRECPECKRRTCESKSKTIRSATRSSTGLRRITRTCRNCKFTDTRDEVIPIITESSSSGGGGGGGGGGSSFGGGSSGGGGAGRSY